MKLPENLLDMADAEFFAGSPELIRAGYDQEVDEGFILRVQESYPSASLWFQSLQDEGKKNVMSYLHSRHGCYAKFSHFF